MKEYKYYTLYYRINDKTYIIPYCRYTYYRPNDNMQRANPIVVGYWEIPEIISDYYPRDIINIPYKYVSRWRPLDYRG